MLTFIHTNWTAPAKDNRWNQGTTSQILKNIWYYGLSTAYLKKLGQKVELHTDDFGKLCLDHIPYDKIHLTLNTIPEDIKPYMWAYGKFWALKDCNIDTCHIDADVFIKDIKCVNEIAKNDYDLLVQCQEMDLNSEKWPVPLYRSTASVLTTLNYPSWSSKTVTSAYNTGTIKFNNYKQKQNFISEYLRCALECSTSDKLVYSILKNNNAGIAATPDLILEQQFIYDSAVHEKIKVKSLIEWENATELANNIGYQHVLGMQKYNDDNMYRCVKMLYDLDKDLYQKTLEKIKYIEKYLHENT